MKPALVCIALLLSCWQPAVSEESALRTAGAILKIAKTICGGVYGKTRPQVNQGTLQYYCGRLRHPESFVQDLDWWKQNAPAFLQGPAPVEIKPEHMTPLERERAADAAYLRNCRSRGGPDATCRYCAGQPAAIRNRESMCTRWAN